MAKLNDQILVKVDINPAEIADAFVRIRDGLEALAEAFEGMAEVARAGATQIDAVVTSFNQEEARRKKEAGGELV